jgi:hypothetical protein
VAYHEGRLADVSSKRRNDPVVLAPKVENVRRAVAKRFGEAGAQ